MLTRPQNPGRPARLVTGACATFKVVLLDEIEKGRTAML